MLLAQCAVCQECFTGSITCIMSALPCGHVFHKICVETWFKTSLTCPQCRIDVKRASMINRLFFDILTYPPIDNALNSSNNEENFTPGQANKHNSKSIKSLSIEIHRLRSENIRLEENFKNSEQKLEEYTRMVGARDKEISAISTLYSETDKLYEKERQRTRELRCEVSSLKQFLRDAENMKAEAIQLRKETEDMQNVKKLISSSEDAARELFARYTSKAGTAAVENSKNTNNHNSEINNELFSLCKWATILRSELTSSREKVRNYRTELSRIRKIQISTSQRMIRAESNVNEYKERIKSLEIELSKLICEINTNKNNFKREETSSVNNVHENFKNLSSNSTLSTNTESNSIIDLFDDTFVSTPTINKSSDKKITTPDLLSITPSMGIRGDIRTPSENPFRLKTNTNFKTQNTQNFNRTLIFSASKSNKVPESTSACRRPSSLYQLAIMRQHNKKTETYNNYKTRSNINNSTESYHSVSSNITFQSESTKNLNKMSHESYNPMQKRISRNLKRSASDNSSKTSCLDKFVIKL